MGTSFGCADIVDRGKAGAAEPDVERRDVEMLDGWGVGERHLIDFSSVLGFDRFELGCSDVEAGTSSSET